MNYVGSGNSPTAFYLPGSTCVCVHIVHCPSRSVRERRGCNFATCLFLLPLLVPTALHQQWISKLVPLSSHLQPKNWNSSYDLNNLLTYLEMLNSAFSSCLPLWCPNGVHICCCILQILMVFNKQVLFDKYLL